MRRLLAFTALLLCCAGCGLLGYSAPHKVPRTSFSGHVGKVPVAVIARMIGGTDFGAPASSGHPGIERKPPFLIAVTPLFVQPRSGPWPHVACEWAQQRGPRFMSPPGGFQDELFLSGDDRRIQELWWFDATLQPSQARIDDHLTRYPGGAWIDAFYVAPLCEQGDRVAVVLHYGNPRHLWGQGFLLVLRRSAGVWSVERIRELWIS